MAKCPGYHTTGKTSTITPQVKMSMSECKLSFPLSIMMVYQPLLSPTSHDVFSCIIILLSLHWGMLEQK